MIWFFLAAVGLALAITTAAATALRSVQWIWLRRWADIRLRGLPGSALAVREPHRLLDAANFASSALIVVAGILIWLAAKGLALGTAATVIALGALLLLVGHVIPRAVARRYAPALLELFAPMLRGMSVLARPLAYLSEARFGAARPRSPAATGRGDCSAAEIGTLLREGEAEGIGPHEVTALITGVAEFGETPVSAIMTPRDAIFAVPDTLPPREVAARIAQAQFSRVPVYSGSIDHITGVLHIFDFLASPADRKLQPRAPSFAAPDTPCTDLLVIMLSTASHLYIVRGAPGSTLGLVTLEDLLEELVGDIRDEHDEPIAAAARDR